MLRFLFIVVLFVVFYTGLVQFYVFQGEKNKKAVEQVEEGEKPKHKIYSFSFAKYSVNGEKELEIEGDSADILAKTVDLMNVVAKAYAQEVPVTITADEGFYDKIDEKVHFENNVVATTEDGARLITDELDIKPATRMMETDAPTEVKKDNINIDGEGAIGDSLMKKVKFKKNVTVVIQNNDAEDTESTVPTVITCDGPLVVDYEKNIAHFHDNVVSKDDRGKLNADRMDVYYSKTRRGVSKIVAIGNVVIENRDGNKTYSDSVVYLAEEGRIILGGDTETLYYGSESGADPLKEFS